MTDILCDEMNQVTDAGSAVDLQGGGRFLQSFSENPDRDKPHRRPRCSRRCPDAIFVIQGIRCIFQLRDMTSRNNFA